MLCRWPPRVSATESFKTAIELAQNSAPAPHRALSRPALLGKQAEVFDFVEFLSSRSAGTLAVKQAGQIVLTPFPHTDLSGAKLRPVLMLRPTSRYGDWLVCGCGSQSGLQAMCEGAAAPSCLEQLLNWHTDVVAPDDGGGLPRRCPPRPAASRLKANSSQ